MRPQLLIQFCKVLCWICRRNQAKIEYLIAAFGGLTQLHLLLYGNERVLGTDRYRWQFWLCGCAQSLLVDVLLSDGWPALILNYQLVLFGLQEWLRSCVMISDFNFWLSHFHTSSISHPLIKRIQIIEWSCWKHGRIFFQSWRSPPFSLLRQLLSTRLRNQFSKYALIAGANIKTVITSIEIW